MSYGKGSMTIQCPQCGCAVFRVVQYVTQTQQYDAGADIDDRWGDFEHVLDEEPKDVQAFCQGCMRDCTDLLRPVLTFHQEPNWAALRGEAQ